MARKQRAEQWAEHRRNAQRVMVITEFDAGDSEATMHALADQILKHRHALRLSYDQPQTANSALKSWRRLNSFR